MSHQIKYAMAHKTVIALFVFMIATVAFSEWRLRQIQLFTAPEGPHTFSTLTSAAFRERFRSSPIVETGMHDITVEQSYTGDSVDLFLRAHLEDETGDMERVKGAGWQHVQLRASITSLVHAGVLPEDVDGFPDWFGINRAFPLDLYKKRVTVDRTRGMVVIRDGRDISIWSWNRQHFHPNQVEPVSR